MNNSVRGNQADAGAGVRGGHIQTAPAQFEDDTVQLTHAGWRRVTDGMAASIVRLERELEEAQAQIAVYETERSILLRKRDDWRECAKALADAVDYYHPALRDAEDGFSAERAAIARFDELEALK